MTVNSSDFINLAKSALESKDLNEIDIRSAGSRAYYGVYHKAREVIDNKELTYAKLEKAGSHESLIMTIHRIGSQNSKTLAEAIRSLKRYRHLCDYHLADKVRKNHTQMKLLEAQKLIERLSRL
ncbi:hypothetical protein [Pseudomonas sp. NFX1]|uniref:hypothetical protein n=1 Tax=Pseudomonas sp. NFX1 TaxID=2201355 RepID=UPI003DA6DF16